MINGDFDRLNGSGQNVSNAGYPITMVFSPSWLMQPKIQVIYIIMFIHGVKS